MKCGSPKAFNQYKILCYCFSLFLICFWHLTFTWGYLCRNLKSYSHSIKWEKLACNEIMKTLHWQWKACLGKTKSWISTFLDNNSYQHGRANRDKFPIQNVVLRVSRREKFQNFSMRSLFLLCFWRNVYLSANPRNLPCPEKVLVARLITCR